MSDFIASFLLRKRLGPDATAEERAFHGNLRVSLERFELDLALLLPHIEQIFGRLVHLQYAQYSGMAWKCHWKKVSMDGCDVIKGRCVDYGNVEYYILLRRVRHMSPFVEDCMAWLGKNHFETLRPEGMLLTDHAVEMHGDIFEIVMAALRGHAEFRDVLPLCSTDLPPLFAKLCSVCKTVHMLDGCIRTGNVKWQNVRAPRLAHFRPDLADHPFVQIWVSDGPQARADALGSR